MKKAMNKNDGFILITTMLMLIVMMIIGLSIYQQVTVTARAVSSDRLKSLAKTTSLNALHLLEKEKLTKVDENALGESLKIACNDAGVSCDPPSSADINSVIEAITEGTNEDTIGVFSKFVHDKVNGSNYTSGAVVYYYVQNLSTTTGVPNAHTLFRTTVITSFMGTVDVIESGFIYYR